MSKPALTSQVVRLIVPAGKATAAPPVGPALGARGVKSIDFVKEFNARTAHLVPGTPTPVNITIAPDRSFTFVTKSPTTTHLIKSAAGIELGSGAAPGAAAIGTAAASASIVASISVKHVFEIAKIKSTDDNLKGVSLESIAKSVVASAKSMGVEVVP
ncbi:hypothetical protein MNV49_007859 [Pseudohyphozyma bogoriensis]|nr:hypothetical protein MNV49_007859 [Pseudohyphozyma bogoriensis]